MATEPQIKIVILEDEPAHAEAISRAFEYVGNYDIRHYNTIEDYLTGIENNKPHIVISDLNLPDGDAFNILHSPPEELPYPVLVMTSFGNEEIAVNAMKNGALDYIVKSDSTFREMPHLVNRLLREWNLILEHKQAEIALHKSEERFRMVMEATSDGIWDLDLVSNTAYFSDRYYTMLNYEPGEFPANYENWLINIHPDDKPATLKVLEDHFNNISPEFWVECRMKCKNGTWKWINGRGKVVKYNTLGQPIRIVGTNVDISERKNFENELIKAKDKAEESDKLKTAFLCNISHEIRTPMNGILGFAELLQDPELTDEKKIYYIEVINESCQQLLSVITDIIDISKIESGQMQSNRNIVNINSTLASIYDLFILQSQQKGIYLQYPITSQFNDLEIFTDETKLKQIITNLVNNAIKFTDEGKVEFGCYSDNHEITFFIKDTGIGISPENFERIFDRFSQIESTLARNYGGTGLGLAITKAYVELLGGRIWLTSEIGKGTTFCFTIPFDPADGSLKSRNETSAMATNLSNTKILIAEDNDTNINLLKEIFSKNNIEFYHAKNGREAIEIFSTITGFSLILMDLKMPVMDGFSATRIIKQISPTTPVIALTAYALQEEKNKAASWGFDDYIAKPIKITEILSLISKFA